MEEIELIEIMILIVGVVTAIATVALAIFTWCYVKFTRKLAEESNKLVTETKRMVDEMNMSDVAVFFKNERPDSPGSYFDIHFCIKNAGTQTVRKVRFNVQPSSFKPGYIAIGNIPWVKNGIEVLTPGNMESRSIFQSNKTYERDKFYENNESKVKIKIKYEDIFKREHNVEFPLDLHEIDI